MAKDSPKFRQTLHLHLEKGLLHYVIDREDSFVRDVHALRPTRGMGLDQWR